MSAVAEGAVCANIGPKERRMRVMVGFAGALLAIGLAAGLVILKTPAWTRLFVVLPAAVSAAGFFQARARTCVAFAAQGIKVLGDSRTEAVKVSEAEQVQISRQARGVYINIAVATVLVGGLVMLLP